MALSAKSLFLFNLDINTTNNSLDFRAASGGPELQATLITGYYDSTSLAAEIVRAMEEVDSLNSYTVTIDRTTNDGTSNRVTISTSGSYLDLLFGTGSRVGSSVRSILGYTLADKTGATSYESESNMGTILIPALVGYSYTPTTARRKVFGSLNISATGQKEAIVFQIQEFFSVQFKYEPSASMLVTWPSLMNWLIQQRPIEFTPEISNPNSFIQCTLETTPAESKGLGYTMREMLPEFPGLWDTGLMTFRKKV